MKVRYIMNPKQPICSRSNNFANFFTFLIALFVVGSGYAQSINDPGFYGETWHSDAAMDADHLGLESRHAMPKIELIEADEATESMTEFWPEGTWNQGFFNSYNSGGYDTWYEEGLGNHPLIRTIAVYLIGYMHANRSLPLTTNHADFEERALSALDYLVDTQLPGGGFVWWRYRPGSLTPNTDETLYPNEYSMFSTGFALKALSEGYWFKKCHLGLPADEIREAIILCGDFVLDHIHSDLRSGSNANERALVLWGLSTAYKATGEEAYRDSAVVIANMIMDTQFPEGDWQTDGAPEAIPGTPEGGPKPLEHWISGDFDGDGKDELLQKYAPATQIYLHQHDLILGKDNLYHGTQHLEKWIVGNFDGDPEDEVLHKFIGSSRIYIWNYGENFGVNTVYSGPVHLEDWICGDFDNDGTDEVLQRYAGSNTIYLWGNGDSFGSNSIYTGSATLENWLVGNFDADPNIEVLQKYSGATNIYLWNDGTAFGSNSIYTGAHHIQNWLAGDFDNDGKDEVLQKYTSSSYIYLWDGAYAFGSNSVYTGALHIDQWIAGDFDGDNRDEVLQKYLGVADIYQWNYGSGFIASKPYEGPHNNFKWITVNVDGSATDQLFQIFDSSERIYYWNPPENCMGCYSIFNFETINIKHDSRMQYHFFILGGLIEAYSITTGTEKASIASAIKKAVNHVIVRLSPDDPSKMSNYYYDIHRNVIPLFIREQHMFNSREAVQQFPQLAYYAASDPANFTTTDVNRIIHLGNRMARNFEDFESYAYYKDYMNAINADTYLDYYGGCAEGVFLPPVDDPIEEHPGSRGPLSLPDANTTPEQNVYPNPVHDILNITDSKDFLYAEVYNSVGKRIRKYTSVRLDLSDLAGGVYLIKIYRGNSIENQQNLDVQTEIIVKT